MVNIVENYHDTFESTLRSYLSERDLIDPVLPECDDVEQKWEQIATSFMPDALREFGDYPDAVLAWMMYIGMAVAKYWDVEWNIYDKIPDLYNYIREKRGFDNIDDYICDEVLLLTSDEKATTQKQVVNVASFADSLLMHSGAENGTENAFKCFLITLNSLYRYGCYMQLKRMGYKMTRM
ncbi:MAG: hypothetical protein SOX54_08480 [Prevotella sp.]|nr:hypothetical protein [Prevotella sp.]